MAEATRCFDSVLQLQSCSMDDVNERFLLLAQRELSADHVRLLARGDLPPDAPNVVVARLRDGRHVVASFSSSPTNGEALARRLAMLATTFADAFDAPPSNRMRSRPPPLVSLQDELKALVHRSMATDAVVIDGDSPVVWGSASAASRFVGSFETLLRDVSDRELLARAEPAAPSGGLRAVPALPTPSSESYGSSDDAAFPPGSDAAVRTNGVRRPTAPTGVLRVAPPPQESALTLSATSSNPGVARDTDETESDAGESAAPDNLMNLSEEPEATRRAIELVRQLPSLDLLRKGRHLRHVARGEANCLVLSFSSIYLLCLVFEGAFDELRAERAAQESLPRIERLVLALPPLDPDPSPVGGVVALRRSGRR